MSNNPIPSVPGFKAAGISCGIKEKGLKDLALIISEKPAVSAGVFTLNKVKSPSVLWSQKAVKKQQARAILINSGNANACTGPHGVEACKSIAEHLAKIIDAKPGEILLSSTGIIGVPLPTDKILNSLSFISQRASRTGWQNAADAILTTDLVPKTAKARVKLGNKTIEIGGFAKGSGMIHPNMATMLGFVYTNAAIDAKILQSALKEATDLSFNSITVDGDCSTNDCVLALANGGAGNTPIRSKNPAYKAFVHALTKVCRKLAVKIVEDGEGATKLVTVKVSGARTDKDAKQVAMTVANSKLVKTALFGEDPNWGRILCAAGYSGAGLVEDKVDIQLNRLPLLKRGIPSPETSMEKLEKAMRDKDIEIALNLRLGKGKAEVYTCDLSYEYIRINAEYTT